MTLVVALDIQHTDKNNKATLRLLLCFPRFLFFFYFFLIGLFEIILGTDLSILGAYLCKAPVLTKHPLSRKQT